MLKWLFVLTAIILILAVNTRLIPQVYSSSESSPLFLEDSGSNDNGGDGSKSENESPQDDSGEIGGSSSGSGDNKDNNNNNDGITRTDDQELTSDNDEKGREPPLSEREIDGTAVPKPDYPSDCPAGTYFNVDASRGKECLPCIPDVDPNPACQPRQEQRMVNQSVGNSSLASGLRTTTTTTTTSADPIPDVEVTKCYRYNGKLIC